MTKWLNQQEAVMWFNSYHHWRDGGHTTDRLADENSNDSDNPTPEVNQAESLTPYCVTRHPHSQGGLWRSWFSTMVPLRLWKHYRIS